MVPTSATSPRFQSGVVDRSAIPPSIPSTTPVTQSASRLEGYRTADVTSSGSPQRRNAVARATWSWNVGFSCPVRLMSVRMNPGVTALARIAGASSIASARVICSIPPPTAWYGTPPTAGSDPRTEETVTIAAWSERSRYGSAARTDRKGPSSSVAMSSAQSAAPTSSTVGPRKIPGRGDESVEAALPFSDGTE